MNEVNVASAAIYGEDELKNLYFGFAEFGEGYSGIEGVFLVYASSQKEANRIAEQAIKKQQTFIIGDRVKDGHMDESLATWVREVISSKKPIQIFQYYCE